MPKKAQETPVRAERFPVHIPVLYRKPVSSEWLEARTENVSYTGILFPIACDFEPNTLVDVKLQVPPIEADSSHAEVVCKCEVVRVEQSRGGRVSPALAVAIHNYRFTRIENGNSLPLG